MHEACLSAAPTKRELCVWLLASAGLDSSLLAKTLGTLESEEVFTVSDLRVLRSTDGGLPAAFTKVTAAKIAAALDATGVNTTPPPFLSSSTASTASTVVLPPNPPPVTCAKSLPSIPPRLLDRYELARQAAARAHITPPRKPSIPLELCANLAPAGTATTSLSKMMLGYLRGTMLRHAQALQLPRRMPNATSSAPSNSTTASSTVASRADEAADEPYDLIDIPWMAPPTVRPPAFVHHDHALNATYLASLGARCFLITLREPSARFTSAVGYAHASAPQVQVTPSLDPNRFKAHPTQVY